MTPVRKRTLVEFLRVGYKLSVQRSCRLIGLNRSTYYVKSRAKDDTALRMRLRDLAASRVRYGYRRLHILLEREGWRVNHKRVHRLYKLEGLSLRFKRSKKRIGGPRLLPAPALTANERWSMDFVSDRLANGLRFRLLTLVDHFSRVSPAIEVGSSFSGEHVATVLDRLAALVGLPREICVDNGPEFASKALDAWAYRRGVKLRFSRPGKPTDNAYIESFNGRLREECLNLHWFASMEEARRIIENWRHEYNTQRPHSALNNRVPSEVAAGCWID